MVKRMKGVDGGGEMEENEETGASNAGMDDSLGFYLAPWKCDADNEEKIKQDCKATIRCYPFEHNLVGNGIENEKCFYSGDPATHWAIFARAF